MRSWLYEISRQQTRMWPGAAIFLRLVNPKGHLRIHTVLSNFIVLYSGLHIIDIHRLNVLYRFGSFIYDVLDGVLKTNTGITQDFDYF